MFERQNRRKYGWADKSRERTEECRETKENNTYIVYEKEGKFVKEFPDGKIIPINVEGES